MVVALLVAAFFLASGIHGAEAVEYRLQVVNLHEPSFTHFLNGSIGTGSGELVLDRLEHALDAGEVGRGGFVPGRLFEPAREGVAQAFGAVKVRGDIRAGEGKQIWDEVVWDGKPGERSLWVLAPTTVHFQEVRSVGLKGSSGLRYYLPYRVSGRPTPQAVVTYPLAFLHFYEDRGGLWERYLSRSVGLGEGIAVVVGENENASFADWVFLIVQHPSQPTTFKAVVGWDRREVADRSSKEGRFP